MMSKFSGMKLDIVPSFGGSNRVTIPATPYQIRGGTGTGGATSVPCRMCKMIAASGSSNIRVRIDSAASTSTGIPVPEWKLSEDIKDYLTLPIDDLNRLYFIGDTQSDKVDILYWG
jgi:hypothetical protein